MDSVPNHPTPLKGTVLNIQHFCTNDGPGMRTTVFLKGCSLRCKWCSNPESIHPKPELAYNPSKCIGKPECGFCLKECPEHAIFTVDPDIKVRINWDLCTNCGKCVPVCPPQALYAFGQAMTVDEVLAEVEQDSSFYRESGGGITLSGGECQLQADFAAALLEEAHRRGINTAIETAFNVPWKNVEKVLPHVDVCLHDHKATDPERHKKWCGADNSRIRENQKRAYAAFPNVKFIARTPVIPGVNDDEAHFRAVLDFIRPHPNVINYELLPYFRFGESKYGFLGRVYEMEDIQPPKAEVIAQLRTLIDAAFGRTVRAADSSPPAPGAGTPGVEVNRG
jgi:pyruvate formate lyase activating enzyme